MICLQRVNHTYFNQGEIKHRALENISLKIPRGSFTAIIGSRNSGKTTLGKILCGLLTASSGQIIIDGLEISHWNLKELRKTIGMVLSHPDEQIIFPTIEEDLSFGLENFQVNFQSIKHKITEILRLIGLEKFRHLSPFQLSGGQRQKLAIAAMLLLDLQYLILDEPISFLDKKARKEILTLIEDIHQRGVTIIYMAQFYEELLLADTIVALNKGSIQWQGSLGNLMERPSDLAYWGIEVPPIVHLVDMLRSEGFSLPSSLYTIDEFVIALQRIKYENRSH